MAADNYKKKASRGLLRTVTFQVTKDPNDKTGEYIDEQELISHYRQRVTQAEIWECPIESLSPLFQTIGIVHQGVVITMEDGKKYLVHKAITGKSDGVGFALVAYSANMGKHWALVKTKNVRRAKLEDYLDKCGDRYDFVSDNCLHAVQRMWELD